MVTFIDLNTTNEDKETVNAVKTAFEYVFRYTKKVNVHVIFNFKSPINIVGNCKRVRDATLFSIFQFFTFAARI